MEYIVILWMLAGIACILYMKDVLAEQTAFAQLYFMIVLTITAPIAILGLIGSTFIELWAPDFWEDDDDHGY